MRLFPALTIITTITFSSYAYTNNSSICDSREDFQRFFHSESLKIVKKHCQNKFGIQDNDSKIRNLISSKYQELSERFRISICEIGDKSNRPNGIRNMIETLDDRYSSIYKEDCR